MTRVVLTDSDRFPFGPADLEMLAGAGIGLDEVPGHDPDAIAAAAAGADAVFVYSGRFDAALIGRLEGCRVLARCGVGYDNIDVAAAQARGIAVTYVPSYGAQDVAEHAIALMLACARRLAASDRAVQSGGWPSFAGLGPMRRLAGRTLGLVGYGRIAREVAARARGLRLHVIAHDPNVDPTAGAALDVRLMPLQDMLAAADFVSLHVPLGPATRHLIDDVALSAMRPDAYLINTSRGAVVDQDALVRALDAGRIGGAALDVLEREPAPAGAAILGRLNVMIPPHSAAYTQEAFDDLRRTALTDVLLILGGGQPRFPVPGPGTDAAEASGPGADGAAATDEAAR
jgi:D-3-phosphoglycerate dehydrogenase / 2-oxoglutarate reductase